jgi:carboxypeptidase family protein
LKPFPLEKEAIMGREQQKSLTSKQLVFQAVLLLLSAVFVSAAHAQTSTVGTISGTVRDPNGAAVGKAEIIFQEERTGYSRTVKADDTGFFSAQSLPVGRYIVTTSPQGFKKYVNSGLELHVGEDLVLAINLQVGQMSETVNVTAEAVQVETRSGDVSSLVAEKQVTELPLDGRNYAALVTMVPGVSPALGTSFAARGTGLDSHVDMSVNGNQSNGNMWTVDGVNNMDVGSNATLLVFPSIDSIAEFRVERNSFSAEFGQAQGAVINLITKGGTNRFHGTAFEFLRNDALNATDFFLNTAGQPKQVLRYNNFGFNVNGPILKDKLFFFYSEEWRREGRGTVLGSHVPTAAEKVGDFSGALTAPLPHDVNGNPFPGNRIPTNRLSPAGLAILKIFPDPNNADPNSNWTTSVLEPVKTRQDLIRGDWTINSKMNLMVRYINETWTHGNASNNFWGDTPFPTLSSDWDQPSNSFAVKLSTTLTTTSVNEFQFSRAGNDIFVSTNASGQALNDEIASKFPTVFPRTAGTGLPTVGWGGQGYPTLWHQAPWQNHEDLWIWKDDYSKVWGSHSLKFGGLISHNIKNEQPAGGSGLYTVQEDGGGGVTGNYIASLLLKDIPVTQYTEIDHQETTLGRWHDFEFYGNDTWKIRPTLTINLGLRWSRYTPAYSDNNRISNFVPSLFNGTNPLTGLVQADQAEAADLSRSLVNPYNGGFQPRLGVAWDVFGDGKTALRLGFGRYIGRTNVIEDILRMAQNPPWSVTVDSGWQGGRTSLTDCPTCRSLDTINPGLKLAVAGVGPNTGFNAVNTNFRPPESWQWNITISRELMKDTILEASYVGNHGLHLWRRAVPYNDIVPSARPLLANAIRNGQDTAAIIADNAVHKGLGPITGSESSGDSTYNAFQLWLNRRFANRLAFQAAYTWSHTITNVPLTSFTNATTDPFNYDLDKGDADLDRRHMFVANAVYELPSLQQWGSVAKQVLGSWQFNTIVTLTGGTPINVTCGCNSAGVRVDGGNQRPDVIPGVPIFLHTGDNRHFLNPAAFALPAVGTFGSLGRGSIKGPGTENVDFSINKNWRFMERYGIQFRAEMFNAFNHANFGANEVDAGLSIQQNRNDPNFGKVTNGNFGVIGSPYRGPREIQFGLKFSF